MINRLLWIDCGGGLVVGVVVLALSGWLAPLEGLPRGVLMFTGVMNLVYGLYSLSLARQARRSVMRVKALAIANMAWAPVCILILLLYADTATAWAWVHLVGEGVYVGALGAVEWRCRDRLLGAA